MSSPAASPLARSASDGPRRADGQQDVSTDPSNAPHPTRPAPVTHRSMPAYETPLRHHQRKASTPRQVKETLHAHSEYTNSEDDGTAIHRINQYVIKQEIGRGSFGAVHYAVDQHGNEYAVKEFSKARLRKRAQSSILRRPHHRARPVHRGTGLNAPMHHRNASDIHSEEAGGNPLYLIREEIAIMKKLNHNNLVSLLEVLDDPTEDSLYMVMEMCKKGVVMKVEVGDRADPYEPEECRCWFRDLILGIEYLHAQGIVHRDIKPDNLLLTDDDVLKVVDFGVSEMFEKESDMTTTKSAGSPAFLPPELCISHHGAISGKAVDIWSMGVTLYCLYHGKVPFEQHTVLDLYEAIKNDQPQVIAQEGDEDFPDLMARLLEKDPEKRVQMEELREHPWVTRRGTDPLLPAHENTSDLLEPPTEEEMNHAITGNLSNLIVVMKAARKFRSLLQRKRPYLFDSVLDQGSQLVQPPLSIDENDVHPLPSQSQQKANRDKPPAKQVLTTEGMHQITTSGGLNSGSSPPDSIEAQHDLGAQSSPSAFRSGIQQPTPRRPIFPHRGSSQRQSHDSGQISNPSDVNSPKSPDHTGKGQAHDPMDEFRFLQIGAGGDDAGPLAPGATPAVCESPPAAEEDIYETAYHEEVERIRSRSMDTKLYLTRRVEFAAGVALDDASKSHQKVAGAIGGVAGVAAAAVAAARRQNTAPAVPQARHAAITALGHVRQMGLAATNRAVEKVEGAAETVQTAMREVKAESTVRQGQDNEKTN